VSHGSKGERLRVYGVRKALNRLTASWPSRNSWSVRQSRADGSLSFTVLYALTSSKWHETGVFLVKLWMTMTRSAKNAVAGAVGGLAGTLAMNYAQRLWTLVVDRNAPASAAGPHDARDWQERTEDQNSNELAAQVLACATINRRLSDRELSIAAPIIHFSFGAAVAAMYGAYLNPGPRNRPSGVALGSALWLAADEIAMPRLGLSRPTMQRPLEKHCQSFVAHLVYGIVAERVRHATRRAFG
jgi:uncharacterized protein DUF1440